MVRDEPPHLLATCSYEFTEDVYESLCRAKKKRAAGKLLPTLLLLLVLLYLSYLFVGYLSYVAENLRLGADDFLDDLIVGLLCVGLTILVVLFTVKNLYDHLYAIFVGRSRSWPASLDHEGPDGSGEYRTFLVKTKVDYDGIDIWYIPREDPDSKNAHSARKLFWSGPKKGLRSGNWEVGWDRVVKIDDPIVVLGNETTDSKKRQGTIWDAMTGSNKGQDTIWDAIILENAVMSASCLRGTSADNLYHEIKGQIKWAKNRRRWTDTDD